MNDPNSRSALSPRAPGRPALPGALFALAAALLLPASLDAAPNLRPGEWEYSMKTKIEGLGIPIPSIPVKFTECVTATKPFVETPEMKKAGCKLVDKKIKGNAVRYTARCQAGDSITETRYRLNFKRDTMEGTFDQVRKVGGKVRSTATGTIGAKRLGACKSPAKR